MLHHIEKPDQTVKGIIAACFPKYTGKKIKISTNVPSRLSSYWDGGSRTYYAFYHLDQHKVLNVESNHPMFEAGKPSQLEKLPNRLLLVAHSIVLGKDAGVTIYANADDLAPMLPKNEVELTKDELIVLTFTRSFKSSYAGIPNYRFHEARRVYGTLLNDWENAVVSLISKGLLDKRRAITAAGKNALQGKEVRTF